MSRYPHCVCTSSDTGFSGCPSLNCFTVGNCCEPETDEETIVIDPQYMDEVRAPKAPVEFRTVHP